MTGFHFAYPLVFLAVPAAALLLWLPWVRARRGMAWRGVLFVSLACAAAAAAGPHMREPVIRSECLLFLVDTKAVHDRGREEAAREVARWAGEAASEGMDLCVMVLARRVTCATFFQSPPDRVQREVARLLARADRAGPGIRPVASLVEIGLCACPSPPRAVFLLSTGLGLRSGPPSPTALHTVPLPCQTRRDFAILHLRLPQRLREGEPVLLDVRFQANYTGQGTLVLLLDGDPVGSQEVSFAESDLGGATFPGLSFKRGRHRIEVRFRGEDDFEANNRMEEVRVVQDRLRVLVVAQAEAARMYGAALKAQDILVWVTTPVQSDPALLSRVDAVILDAPPSSLSENRDFLSGLDHFVREKGGGLFIVFGEKGFAPAAFEPTSLGRMSPLMPAPVLPPKPLPKPKPKPLPPPKDPPVKALVEKPMPGPPVVGPAKKVEVGRAALVLLIDKSGSMAGPKIAIARQAAVGATEELGPDDLLGIVTFDSEARWLVPLMPAKNDRRIQRLIAGLEASGGTNIYPALVLAQEGLKKAEAEIHHVILISDGFNQNVEDFKGLVERMGRDGISVSTIGVGASFDPVLLSSIAYWSRGDTGKFDFACDFTKIPKIVLVHTRWAADGFSDLPKTETAPGAVPPPTEDERPKTPIPEPEAPPVPLPAPSDPKEEVPPPPSVPENPAVKMRGTTLVHPAPPFAGLSPNALPALVGARQAQARPLSDVLLASEDGWPLFAVMNVGQGRVAALAGELARGKEGFLQWNRFGTFLAQTLRWLPFSGPSTPRFAIAYRYVAGHGGEVRLRLDGSLEKPMLVLNGSDGLRMEVRLRHAGGGIWTGRWTGPFAGPIRGEIQGAVKGSPMVFGMNPVLPPQALREPDNELLMRIAHESGGRFKPSPPLRASPVLPMNGKNRPLAFPFLIAAAALLLPTALLRRRRTG